ncbi:hypothetical protein GCM10009765_15720 [Fodinicola feengrottensis]|uniref:TIGR02679 family protein n=1 Tax=Fodinicola feengrottensis TaxID=435914 RepID=A0ABN2G8F1_9ACTN
MNSKMSDLPAALVAWARLSGPTIVLDAIRLRAGRGAQLDRGDVRVDLTAAQRREVARLLGTPWDVSGRPPRLQDLAAGLAEHGLTVRAYLESLDGAPIVDRRKARAAQRFAVEAEHSTVLDLLSAEIDSASSEIWLSDLGLPRPGDGALHALVEQVLQVWQQLPGEDGPPVRLAYLAAGVLGNAHALDYNELLGRAVCRLIATVHGLPRPLSASRDWRRAWAAAGVRCDEISSRVLALNLPLRGASAAARWCEAADGEPLWLSLRAISGDWSVPSGIRVYVCENPTVVEAAADALGDRCLPLICTDGLASLAAVNLVAGLAKAGCEILVRADIDDSGFVLVDQLRTAAPAATTWRFDSATYAQHLGLSDVTGEKPLLRELYARYRVPLHEEAILDDLVSDLGA